MPEITLSNDQIEILLDLINIVLHGSEEIKEQEMSEDDRKSYAILEKEYLKVKEILESSQT